MIFSERIFKTAFIVVVIAFVLIIGRLFLLQLIRGEKYLERSESNFIQERPIAHSRGLIFDQSGVPLVDNRSAHDVYVTLAMLPDSLKSLRILAPFLEIDNKAVRALDRHVHAALAAHDHDSIALGENLSYAKCREILKVAQDNQITGVAMDKNGQTSCDIVLMPLEFPSQELGLRRLQSTMNLPGDEMNALVASMLKKSEGLGRFKPILFMSDVDFDTYARIESASSIGELPGVAVYDSKRRRYIYGPFAAHAFGYLNEISPAELDKKKGEYRPGDRIGRRGLEAVYETTLRGQDGVERFVVDAKGRRYSEEWEKAFIGEDRITPPVPGNSLTLAIDKSMQDAAEKGFLGKAGSVVAVDVNTGFVLVFASFPTYDPNLLLSRYNAKLIRELSQDFLKPWINKATQEHYAPGSTFKAVTAIAGLEHGLITPKTRETCTGTFHLGSASWRCFKREGHGVLDLVDALKVSCDSYFYQVGYALGPDRLAETARLLGFGRKTGVDLDAEGSGIIPDKPYYVKRRGYYSPGLVVNSSIGQGDVTVTPIQLAVAYSAIVNGGTIYKPQLVRQELSAADKVVLDHQPVVMAHLSEATDSLSAIKEGLSYVMEPGGTAYGVKYRYDLPELSKWLRESGVKIGGKTGTAQVVRLSKAIKHLRPEEVTYAVRDHAWFVGFSPIEKPEIVVVAMDEHGGFGGVAAAPVVASVIKAWYDNVRGHGHYKDLGDLSATQQ